MTPQHTLGDLQLAIMRVLWAAGEASVADVTRSLPPEKSRALTTIATMLTKMEKKGVVAHRSEGRQYLYRPLVSEGEVKRSMLQELAQRLFEGDYAELVSYLVDERELDARELDALKDRVA
ncbi:MAG: BlaI/MecI/CopY family transcriptional regulator, partial [Planctomycetes bacterium]|nr:BlaI/MecI/CopY family transcriptional regulator [Planctomycetota bacterium]